MHRAEVYCGYYCIAKCRQVTGDRVDIAARQLRSGSFRRERCRCRTRLSCYRSARPRSTSGHPERKIFRARYLAGTSLQRALSVWLEKPTRSVAALPMELPINLRDFGSSSGRPAYTRMRSRSV